jgi:hypothetical protein
MPGGLLMISQFFDFSIMGSFFVGCMGTPVFCQHEVGALYVEKEFCTIKIKEVGKNEYIHI